MIVDKILDGPVNTLLLILLLKSKLRVISFEFARIACLETIVTLRQPRFQALSPRQKKENLETRMTVQCTLPVVLLGGF